MKTILLYLLLLHIICINIVVVIYIIATKLEDVFRFSINTSVSLLLLKFAPVMCTMVRVCVCAYLCEYVCVHACARLCRIRSVLRAQD